LRRFWHTASGFWSAGRGLAWSLITFLAICVVLQLLVQYRLNLWNRDFFNALEARNSGQLRHQAYLLPAFAAASVLLAVSAVWGRMTFQRRWREWLTRRLTKRWLARDNYRRLDADEPEPQLAEYRIAEDARVATDAPIDLAVGLLSSTLTAATFVAVLWNVGGSFDLTPHGIDFVLPGYLVICSLAYGGFANGAMMLVGRNMARVIERKNQAESQFKFILSHVREKGAGGPGPRRVAPIAYSLGEVLRQWRRLCGQHMRTTLVSHGHTLLAPLVGLVVCVPKYIDGSMMLGEVTQAAAAFAAVQGAFNWLVDNYPRLAEWASSAARVGNLLLALDRIDAKAGSPQPLPA